MYIKSRSDVKGGTKNVYRHTQEGLIEYFGASKPLSEISEGDADDWRRWLATSGKRSDGSTRKRLGDNTIRRRCGVARQFFRAALRKRLIVANPFGEMKGISVRSNRERDYFVTRDEAAKVVEACPDAQWRLLFALSRYGGLRCPSEHLALRWGDIDWANKRITVTSPKTEHHEGQGVRVIPMFPELQQLLEDVWELAAKPLSSLTPKEQAKVHVITRYRDVNANLRTQLERIIARAGLTPWPKLFQNLRASRATELAAEFPSHVAAEWMGHSALVAQKHYWRTTDADFEKATTAKALQNPVQSGAALSGSEEFGGEDIPGNCEFTEKSGPKQHARQDSNLRPAD
ncbi:tyrosine-type recombinase/integrase [Lacipirellula parvula]|uniref:tyrosine-type recombinase/integrase n=1 Tax=Lacipirellula parvula TaxID=2650471 RepID=UPI003B84B238